METKICEIRGPKEAATVVRKTPVIGNTEYDVRKGNGDLVTRTQDSEHAFEAAEKVAQGKR